MIRHSPIPAPSQQEQEEEQFSAWFDECILSSNQARHKTLQVDAYWDYQLWCIDHKQKSMPARSFGRFLRDTFPFSSVKLKGKRMDNLFQGLILKDAGDWQTPLKGYDSNYQLIA